MILHNFVVWLGGNEWSTALHESLYMYSLIESTHVLSIMVFVGCLAIVDLRIMGVLFTEMPVTTVSSKVLPWAIGGFVALVISGIFLFYAIPVRTYHSLFFRIKMILFVIAGINAWVYHYRVGRNIATWDSNPKPPSTARISAGVSLTSWALVIVAGRMIAYNWFDCDIEPGAFVEWFAGCVPGTIYY